MRSVVLESPKVVHIKEAEPLQAAKGQALVGLRQAGICGSDLSAYRGTSPLVSYPRVLGHELLVDVLDAPDRPELVGNRAVIEPLLPCGRCRACKKGRYNCCSKLQVMGVHVDGGLRDNALVDIDQLYPVPDGMPDDVAVLAEPTSIAYHAIQRSAIDAGEVAVVFGAGIIGLLIACLLMRARGCRVMSIDIDEWRLRVVESLGAIPLQGDRDHLMLEVSQATGGEMADAVFEATGNATCTRMTTDLVAHAGKIVLIGWNRGPVEVDTVSLMQKEADLLGSRNSSGAFPAVLRLLADGAVDPSKLITHRFGMNEPAAALKLLDHGQGHPLKIIIEGQNRS